MLTQYFPLLREAEAAEPAEALTAAVAAEAQTEFANEATKDGGKEGRRRRGEGRGAENVVVKGANEQARGEGIPPFLPSSLSSFRMYSRSANN